MVHWIDNADSYICPTCRFETDNPNKFHGRCPRCGFMDAKDDFCSYGERKDMAELKWNVFYHDFNKQTITTLNIFDHGGFANDVSKSLKKCKTKEEFAEKLRRDLFYYFGSKCEYEVIIAPWVGTRDTKEIKVDVCNQVRLNWDVFLDYVWNSKKRKNVEYIEDLSDGALD